MSIQVWPVHLAPDVAISVLDGESLFGARLSFDVPRGTLKRLRDII